MKRIITDKKETIIIHSENKDLFIASNKDNTQAVLDLTSVEAVELFEAINYLTSSILNNLTDNTDYDMLRIKHGDKTTIVSTNDKKLFITSNKDGAYIVLDFTEIETIEILKEIYSETPHILSKLEDLD